MRLGAPRLGNQGLEFAPRRSSRPQWRLTWDSLEAEVQDHRDAAVCPSQKHASICFCSTGIQQFGHALSEISLCISCQSFKSMVTAFCCFSAAAQESLLLQCPAIGQNEHAPNLNWNLKNALTTYQQLSLSSPGGTRQRSACKIRIYGGKVPILKQASQDYLDIC